MRALKEQSVLAKIVWRGIFLTRTGMNRAKNQKALGSGVLSPFAANMSVAMSAAVLGLSEKVSLNGNNRGLECRNDGHRRPNG